MDIAYPATISMSPAMDQADIINALRSTKM